MFAYQKQFGFRRQKRCYLDLQVVVALDDNLSLRQIPY